MFTWAWSPGRDLPGNRVATEKSSWDVPTVTRWLTRTRASLSFGVVIAHATVLCALTLVILAFASSWNCCSDTASYGMAVRMTG